MDQYKFNLEKLEKKTLIEDFWTNKEEAQKLLKKIKEIKEKIYFITSIDENIDLLNFHLELLKDDKNISSESLDLYKKLHSAIYKLEMDSMLNSQDDIRDAIINIHPGAGGKESQDWAFMLFRMYKRWVDQSNYDMSILNYQDGDENGIKDVSIEVKGINAYGFLKSERGVHRLIRISPFDSNSRRHTSFASVFIYPIISDDIKVDIDEKDLKIDTYRASGAGGQHVNKTDSAVRITHLPTNIVVQCQNQRSQLKNKSIALKILSSKLYQLKLDEINSEKSKLNSSKSDIAWGNQIRSYIFHPYNLIKDHRTNYETSNISSVLDGDLNIFIRKYLLLNMENDEN